MLQIYQDAKLGNLCFKLEMIKYKGEREWGKNMAFKAGVINLLAKIPSIWNKKIF